MPESQINRVKALANLEGEGMSVIVRRAIAEYIVRHKDALALAESLAKKEPKK
jgi:hypothetical protein